MERKLVKIGEAAALIGSTVADLLALGDTDAPTICYARVSSQDQKSDLDRQHELAAVPCGNLDDRDPPICSAGRDLPEGCRRHCEDYFPGLTEQERRRALLWARIRANEEDDSGECLSTSAAG